MNRAFLFGLILWVVCAMQSPADDFLGTRVSEFNGKRYLFNLSAKALSAAPEWKQTDDFPPLPPLKAQEVALKKAKVLCPSVGEWNVNKICLEHIHQTYSAMPTFWIYLVDCEDMDGPYFGPPRVLEIPVMMNGVPIKPQIASNRR